MIFYEQKSLANFIKSDCDQHLKLLISNCLIYKIFQLLNNSVKNIFFQPCFHKEYFVEIKVFGFRSFNDCF